MCHKSGLSRPQLNFGASLSYSLELLSMVLECDARLSRLQHQVSWRRLWCCVFGQRSLFFTMRLVKLVRIQGWYVASRRLLLPVNAGKIQKGPHWLLFSVVAAWGTGRAWIVGDSMRQLLDEEPAWLRWWVCKQVGLMLGRHHDKYIRLI